MNNTHSELISNIKRLIAKIKALPLNEHPDFHAVSQAVREGKDPHAHHAYADILQEQGHDDSYARQSPEHAQAHLAQRYDPRSKHPDVHLRAARFDQANKILSKITRQPASVVNPDHLAAAEDHFGETEQQFYETLAKHEHPLAQHIEQGVVGTGEAARYLSRPGHPQKGDFVRTDDGYDAHVRGFTEAGDMILGDGNNETTYHPSKVTHYLDSWLKRQEDIDKRDF